MNARLILGFGPLAFLASLSARERQTIRQGLDRVRDIAGTRARARFTRPRHRSAPTRRECIDRTA